MTPAVDVENSVNSAARVCSVRIMIMAAPSISARPRHSFQTDDSALESIARKVDAGERLSFDDGVTLYRSGDILAVGWMANLVRERLHGDVA
jgi:aminodeoxyfutalosine synthase